MRTVATIVLAAAMGIHCSASADKTATSEPDVVAGPTAEGGEGTPERLAPPIDEQEAPPPTSSDGFVTLPSQVLTSVVGPDGATYVAGTYSGSIVINGSTFTSTGKEDVFIARFEKNGSVAWARSVGSLRNETGPRLAFENDQLKLVATTRGDVDCGAGPIGAWNSEMFFFCYFDNAGAALGGVAFPTGAK